MDENNKIKTLELKDLDCSAVFDRFSNIENYVVSSSSSARNSARPSHNKLKRLFALFSCHKGKLDHHSYEEIILTKQKSKNKRISSEPFYTLCNYPPLYKDMQDNPQL